ncbi:EEV glycoprotein [Deerpox virus W-1170-84]|uniref:EEV glycoprotein n=1 Tax=Deerpox virus (strain W-1170-84) TaxID=305676 RepID=Q08F46_DPV84|nr:EEV glycoprotein [Deerpox virus W-1170-84]AUI80697.1 EEv glycoprotein [White-tailed deer poxvirus]
MDVQQIVIICVIVLACLVLILYVVSICKDTIKKFYKKKKTKPICIRLNSITYSTNNANDEDIKTGSQSSINSDWTDSSGEIYANFRSSKKEKSFKITNEKDNIEVEIVDSDDEFEPDSKDETNLNWDNDVNGVYDLPPPPDNIELELDMDEEDSSLYSLPPPSVETVVCEFEDIKLEDDEVIYGNTMSTIAESVKNKSYYDCRWVEEKNLSLESDNSLV